jgi:acyl-CoA dehydrogenase
MLSKPLLTATCLRSLAKQAASRSLGPTVLRQSSSAAGGLNFALTEEQQSIKDMARKFAREEIAPKAAELDRTGTYPKDIIVRAHELGITTMHLPESVGGQGMGLVDACQYLLLHVHMHT